MGGADKVQFQGPRVKLIPQSKNGLFIAKMVWGTYFLNTLIFDNMIS